MARYSLGFLQLEDFQGNKLSVVGSTTSLWYSSFCLRRRVRASRMQVTEGAGSRWDFQPLTPCWRVHTVQSHSCHRLGVREWNHSNFDIYWKKRMHDRNIQGVISIGSLGGFDHLGSSFANHLDKWYHLEESLPNCIYMPESFQEGLCNFGSFPPFVRNPLGDIVPDVVYHLGCGNNYPKYFTARCYWEININGISITQKYNSECKDKTILKV